MKILFLLKKNTDYGTYSGMTSKSGLLNSSKFLLDSLLKNKIISEGKIVICQDGNSVDREVSLFKPNICIIEALWVTPEKLDQNIKLHPGTKFIVRIHSNIPFLAMEGIAMEWIKKYPIVAFNSEKTAFYLTNIVKTPIYLPNIDEKEESDACFNKFKKYVNIGCFGSIRPLKNQLIQAVASISYGDKYNKDVRFHINSQRVEQKGDSALKNIRDLFEGTRHRLIEHNWLSYPTFVDLIRLMDIGLQVSYTESFNIVSADFVHAGVPIITSPDISWQDKSLQVNPNNADEIQEKINEVLKRSGRYIRRQSSALSDYNKNAIRTWKSFIRYQK